MKTSILTLAALLSMSGSAVATAADLSVADLPRIHSEYDANQARWANEYMGKTFEAIMELHAIGSVISNERFTVSFKEKSDDWWPGVACDEIASTPFLLAKNSGDMIRVQGIVDGHAFGTLKLRNCVFTSPEAVVAPAPAPAPQAIPAATPAPAPQIAAPQLSPPPDYSGAAPAKAATADPEASSADGRSYCDTHIDPSFCSFNQPLPGPLNRTFRGMLASAGKRCKAITDHVWVTADHVSVMCDRRLRVAFIHEADGWRLGRLGE
jgi:hypothetical protein